MAKSRTAGSRDASQLAETPVSQAVERAMRLLGFFDAEHRELTLSELTAFLGTSKATTHRYTIALRRAGVLRYDPAHEVYSLGARLVELAASALAGLQVSKIALPHVEALAAEVQETSIAAGAGAAAPGRWSGSRSSRRWRS